MSVLSKFTDMYEDFIFQYSPPILCFEHDIMKGVALLSPNIFRNIKARLFIITIIDSYIPKLVEMFYITIVDELVATHHRTKHGSISIQPATITFVSKRCTAPTKWRVSDFTDIIQIITLYSAFCDYCGTVSRYHIQSWEVSALKILTIIYKLDIRKRAVQEFPNLNLSPSLHNSLIHLSGPEKAIMSETSFSSAQLFATIQAPKLAGITWLEIETFTEDLSRCQAAAEGPPALKPISAAGYFDSCFLSSRTFLPRFCLYIATVDPLTYIGIQSNLEAIFLQLRISHLKKPRLIIFALIVCMNFRPMLISESWCCKQRASHHTIFAGKLSLKRCNCYC